MRAANCQRKEISCFLAESAPGFLVVLKIDSAELDGNINITIRASHITTSGIFELMSLRFSAHNAIDYAIRPKNPAIIEGGKLLKFSTDNPRLNDPMLQYIPGGDGKLFNPPRRYQLLELDQSWIIAQRFEVQELHRTVISLPEPYK